MPDQGTLRKKDTSVSINYNHNYVNLEYEQSSRLANHHNARQIQQNIIPYRHNIKVEPDIADIDLDENLSAEVEVPLDTYMTVDYKNWTLDEPEIYYEYGSSDPFIVTTASPDTVTISISVALNPDYPIDEDDTDNETTECTENCTVDNETIDNETETVDLTLWAHYKFEGDLTDNSSYGRDLTAVGGTLTGTFITFSDEIWSGNIDGQAAWLPGSDDAYAFYNDIDIASTDNFTIAFWVKPLNSLMDQWASVMSTGTSTAGDRFQIDYSGNNKLRFNGAGVTEQMDLEEGEWQHFVFTKFYEENYIYLYNHKLTYYKNGEFKGNKVMVDTYWELLKIGMNRNGGGPWRGYVDDFRIYKRVLTSTEVKELYESYE